MPSSPETKAARAAAIARRNARRAATQADHFPLVPSGRFLTRKLPSANYEDLFSDEHTDKQPESEGFFAGLYDT